MMGIFFYATKFKHICGELLSCQYQRVKPSISTVNESEPSIDSAALLQLPGTLWK